MFAYPCEIVTQALYIALSVFVLLNKRALPNIIIVLWTTSNIIILPEATVVCLCPAVAEALAEWQKLKEDGKLEGEEEEEEEDIYAEARMADVRSWFIRVCVCVCRSCEDVRVRWVLQVEGGGNEEGEGMEGVETGESIMSNISVPSQQEVYISLTFLPSLYILSCVIVCVI